MVFILSVKKPGQVMRHVESLKRIRTRLPGWNSKAMLKWGKILEKDIKLSARSAGIKRFSGTLFKEGIQYRQKPNGRTGKLFMRLYGLHLDSMTPHRVNVNSSRARLLSWASQSRKGNIRKKAAGVRNRKIKDFVIFVKPHPFIRRGWNRARPKLGPILKREYRKSIQETL